MKLCNQSSQYHPAEIDTLVVVTILAQNSMKVKAGQYSAD
jgi:hypothetical protein